MFSKINTSQIVKKKKRLQASMIILSDKIKELELIYNLGADLTIDQKIELIKLLQAIFHKKDL